MGLDGQLINAAKQSFAATTEIGNMLDLPELIQRAFHGRSARSGNAATARSELHSRALRQRIVRKGLSFIRQLGFGSSSLMKNDPESGSRIILRRIG